MLVSSSWLHPLKGWSLRRNRGGSLTVQYERIKDRRFRIAATLAADVLEQGRSLQPWQMSPSSVPKQAQKTAAPTAALARMSYWAGMAGWNAIAADLTDHPYRLEQETLDPVLPG